MSGGVREVVDERHYLAKAKGGGMLRRGIWVDRTGKVVRYNLAYINHSLYGGDNGRVLGYDSAHGRPHRHFKGELTALSGGSFAHVDALFQREWAKIMKEVTHAKD